MSAQLARQIENMQHGDHACLIYDNFDDQVRAVLPFVKAGLARNEACLYIAHDQSQQDIFDIFKANGINVPREIERKALIFSSDNRDGTGFEPQAMVNVLKNLVNQSALNGFSGFRATGEMTWVLGTECGCDRLIEYEGLLNEQFPSKLTGICQYNSKRFHPQTIRDVLRTHPVVILKGKICGNLYCENHRTLEAEGENDLGVRWMMENLVRFHTIEEGLRNMIRVRDDFLSIASHELNTPLATLKLRHQIFARKGFEVEHWKKNNEANLRTVNHLIQIVQGMLDVTKFSKGLLTLDFEDGVDLANLVRTNVSALLDSEQIRLHIENTPKGRWDRVRLNQLIANLLSNAIKYGEGRPLDITVTSNQDFAQFEIGDQGIGISPEDQTRIFELYERAVPYNGISGLGIGLYISDQIVRAHRGTISVESALGIGSTFKVSLPLNQSTP